MFVSYKPGNIVSAGDLFIVSILQTSPPLNLFYGLKENFAPLIYATDTASATI